MSDNKKGFWLLSFAIGATIGAAVGYALASDKDKRDEWMKEVNNLVDKVRSNSKNRNKDQKDSIENAD